MTVESRIQLFVDSLLGALDFERRVQEVVALKNFLSRAREAGGTTYFLGNGASASISSTLAFKALSEQGLRSLAVGDHNLLLGMSRKRSFGEWMVGAGEVLLESDDALVLTSSSGESANVVKLATHARDRGIPVFSLTGFSQSNQLRRSAESALWVDSMNYNVVETAHLLLGLVAVKGLELSDQELGDEFSRNLSELQELDWKTIIDRLAEFAVELSGIDYRQRRILFVGDGSSASLASHLATDFSKSGLTAQALNDHSFLSASQNDFGSLDWIQVGIERSYRAGDMVIFISHGELFPAEKKALQLAGSNGLDFAHHGTVNPPAELPPRRGIRYEVKSAANELVAPSIGLLALAEAFLPEAL